MDQRAQDVGRASAGGDSDQGVGGGKAGGDEVALAFFGGVFGVLGGPAQGSVAASDDPLHQRGRDGKRGRALGGVEDAEAAASPRADVEEAAALGEALGDGVDGARDGGQLRLDRRGDDRVLLVDEGEHLQRGELIDARGARVARFGGECRKIGHIA